MKKVFVLLFLLYFGSPSPSSSIDNDSVVCKKPDNFVSCDSYESEVACNKACCKWKRKTEKKIGICISFGGGNCPPMAPAEVDYYCKSNYLINNYINYLYILILIILYYL